MNNENYYSTFKTFNVKKVFLVLRFSILIQLKNIYLFNFHFLIRWHSSFVWLDIFILLGCTEDKLYCVVVVVVVVLFTYCFDILTPNTIKNNPVYFPPLSGALETVFGVWISSSGLLDSQPYLWLLFWATPSFSGSFLVSIFTRKIIFFSLYISSSPVHVERHKLFLVQSHSFRHSDGSLQHPLLHLHERQVTSLSYQIWIRLLWRLRLLCQTRQP